MSKKKEKGNNKTVHHVVRANRIGSEYLGTWEESEPIESNDESTKAQTVQELHESERLGVIQLIGHLQRAEKVPENIDLTKANPVTLWYVQRTKIDNKTRYQMWTPHKRMNPVWSMGPPHYVLARPEAIDMLRELWVPDAAKWLKEVKRGKLS
jgi:hypothetical protein